MSVVIKDTDNGWRKLVQNVKAGHFTIKLGVDDRPHAPLGIPTDEIGEVHEFGSATVPQRSFLRSFVDSHSTFILTTFKSALVGALFGKVTMPFVQQATGKQFVDAVRKWIDGFIEPPLLPETVARKGSDLPLVDSGQLRDAVVYEVENG